MKIQEKITFLQAYLNGEQRTFSDTFKTEISFYFDVYETNNPKLKFLHNLKTQSEIKSKMDGLLSALVLKYNEEDDEFGEFVEWYLGELHGNK